MHTEAPRGSSELSYRGSHAEIILHILGGGGGPPSSEMCKISLLILHNILHISEEGRGAPPPDFVQSLHGSGGGGGRGVLTRTDPLVSSV